MANWPNTYYSILIPCSLPSWMAWYGSRTPKSTLLIGTTLGPHFERGFWRHNFWTRLYRKPCPHPNFTHAIATEQAMGSQIVQEVELQGPCETSVGLNWSYQAVSKKWQISCVGIPVLVACILAAITPLLYNWFYS